MGYYEAAWEERKGFLIKSSIIGGIISLITNILMAAGGVYSDGVMETVVEFLLMLVVLAIVFIPTVAIVRMMGAQAEGFAIGMLSGLWTTMLSSIFDFGPGMILGLIKLMIFGCLFMVVALGYCVYLPVSSIYYFVRCKMERAAA